MLFFSNGYLFNVFFECYELKFQNTVNGKDYNILPYVQELYCYILHDDPIRRQECTFTKKKKLDKSKYLCENSPLWQEISAARIF